FLRCLDVSWNNFFFNKLNRQLLSEVVFEVEKTKSTMIDERAKFINSLYLKNLIEGNFPENEVKIKAYSVEQSSEVIANEGSFFMKRVLIKYASRTTRDGSLSFIVKINGNPQGRNPKDRDVYEGKIPSITNLLVKCAGNIKFVPELISITQEPREVFVFEDITANGYHAEYIKTGLNLDQSKMSLQKLAFFHAASAVAIANDGDTFKEYASGVLTRENAQFYQDILKKITHPSNPLQIDGMIFDKLKTLSTKIVTKGIDDYRRITPFRVLNHGDFWTRNIFFKYEDNNLVDALFVGFQSAVVGSPLIDLLYFLNTSVEYKTLIESRDQLIYTYHETLKFVLEKLNYKGPIPTLNEIQIDILKNCALGNLS
uniref:CHK kinase-like domain-containing protein n=1 Tax=Phlebotomus papatasi TaxID=29031 RepID=A0A1B0DPX2_PHLPP